MDFLEETGPSSLQQNPAEPLIPMEMSEDELLRSPDQNALDEELKNNPRLALLFTGPPPVLSPIPKAPSKPGPRIISEEVLVNPVTFKPAQEKPTDREVVIKLRKLKIRPGTQAKRAAKTTTPLSGYRIPKKPVPAAAGTSTSDRALEITRPPPTATATTEPPTPAKTTAPAQQTVPRPTLPGQNSEHDYAAPPPQQEPPRLNSTIRRTNMAEYRVDANAHISMMELFQREQEATITVGGVPRTIRAPHPACWNCGGTTHRKPECPEPRTLYCYGCGIRGVSKADCPVCRGRWRQGRYVAALGQRVPENRFPSATETPEAKLQRLLRQVAELQEEIYRGNHRR